MRSRLGLIASIALCAGCGRRASFPNSTDAEQRREQIAQMRRYFTELHFVHSVALCIRVANRSFCRDRIAAQIGLFAATSQSLPQRFRSFVYEAMDLSWARPASRPPSSSSSSVADVGQVYAIVTH